MKIASTIIIRSAVVMGMFALIAWFPTVASPAKEKPTNVVTQSASGAAQAESAEALAETARGSVKDTLKACLSRIPENASAGQRMIAKETCMRDRAERQPIEAVPGS